MAKIPDNPWGVSSRGMGSLFDEPLSFDPRTVTEEEYAIGGKMITIRHEVSDADAVHMTDELWRKHIRDSLARKLGEYILYNNLCETTVMQSPTSFGKTVAIRCYLAPNDQVKLLRVHKA